MRLLLCWRWCIILDGCRLGCLTEESSAFKIMSRFHTLLRHISPARRRRHCYHNSVLGYARNRHIISSPFSSQATLAADDKEGNINNKSKLLQIGDNGTHISLRFNGDRDDHDVSSTYHASWLWSNDPKGVILPSGQRSTTAQWVNNGRPTITDAKIIYCDVDDKNEESSLPLALERIHVPGPTVNDCCHPLAIYGKHSPWILATVGDETLRPYLFITWSDKSTSTYDIEWLQRFQYNDRSRFEGRKRSEIQPIHAVRKNGPPIWHSTTTAKMESNVIYPEGDAPQHKADGLVHVEYSSVIGEDGQPFRDGLFNLLHFIFRDGAVIVSDTPSPLDNVDDVSMVEDDSFPVSILAKAMSGSLSHGMLYGDIFHVRTGERNSNNVAYTSSALCPHQDLAYYESPPGLQLLHCVAMGKSVNGGESTLIDAMAAAYRLRELRRESFETLTKCPATFMKQRDGACMTYRRPHIALSEERCNTYDREITAVHWSPPFEGPVSLPTDDVDKYYEAYADYEQLLNADTNLSNGKDDDLSSYANEFTWKRKLRPGEVLVFNNRRMVHGRNGFTVDDGASPEDGCRHLVGCYTNIDDTLNSYRLGLRSREPVLPVSLLNVGNGTTIVP